MEIDVEYREPIVNPDNNDVNITIPYGNNNGLIKGNYIGTNATGTASGGSSWTGIQLGSFFSNFLEGITISGAFTKFQPAINKNWDSTFITQISQSEHSRSSCSRIFQYHQV